MNNTFYFTSIWNRVFRQRIISIVICFIIRYYQQAEGVNMIYTLVGLNPLLMLPFNLKLIKKETLMCVQPSCKELKHMTIHEAFINYL